MMTALSIARDRACEETNFEHAALLHKRIEKVKMAAKLRDNVVTKISEFNGLALTRGNKSKQLQLWPVIACCWQEPVILDFAAGQSSSQSLDRELRERLTAALEHLRLECNRTEELALFARWYFSSWRDGLWFPFHTLGDLNYRTLVREISKMAGPPN